MAEMQAVDVQERTSPAYLQTVLGALQQQAQPQSFFEHPATALIPFPIGALLAAHGAVTRNARMNQAKQTLGQFDALVGSGNVPEGPEGQEMGRRMGIPDAVLQSGIIESKKVRGTLGYQARQQFNAALPTFNPQLQGPYDDESLRQADEQRAGAANLQDWINRYPEFAASLGNPEAARVGLESQEFQRADALAQFLGLPTGRGGTSPSAPSAPQRPLGASQSPSGAPPSVPSVIPPTTLPGPSTGTGQPVQPPEGQPGGQQSRGVPSKAVLGARTAYVQLAPDVRQRIENAVTAAVKDYPSVSREEALSIAGIESQFRPNAIGPMTRYGWRALGLMQLSPDVIKQYGVQDPFNLEQNLTAGVGEYSRLKALYNGDQRLALAAYNAGEGAVSAAKGVPRFRETLAYVNDVPQMQQWLTKSPHAQTQPPAGQGTGMLVAGEAAPGPQPPSGQATGQAQVPLPTPGQAGQGAPGAQPSQTPPIMQGVDPLGQFDPQGRPMVIKSASVGISGGKRNINVTLQTPAERAFGYIAYWTDQSAENYRVALRDVLGKGISLPEGQVSLLEKQAVERSLVANYQAARADTRLTEAQARERAVQRTWQSTGVMPTQEQIGVVTNPVALAGETTGAQRSAETAEQLTPQAEALRRQKPADEIAGKESGRLASRVTGEQMSSYLLPNGASPTPSMTQRELESSGAREVGKETIAHLDQVNLIQDNLRTMQSYLDEYQKLGFGSKLMPDKTVASLQERYEIQRRATARLLDKLANVGGERERTGGGGGVGIGPVRIGAFGSDMRQLLNALPAIDAQQASAGLGEALATAQAHKDTIWRRAFGTSSP